MTKVKGIMLTEKGVVKKVVRDNIASIESKKIASLGYEKVENKNVLVNEYVDTSGNMVYAKKKKLLKIKIRKVLKL